MVRRKRPYRLRYLKRYRQIGEALLRHGFGYVIDQLDLRHLLPFRRRIFRKGDDAEPLSIAVRLRLVLEELGPTFVKLGQLLSTRADILPADIIEELGKLQDHVPPFSSDEAVKAVETEIGAPLGQRFASFEREPLAAASVAQVHRATLRTGERVVVKIRRPDIVPAILTDLEILIGLAELVKERMRPEFFDPVAVVEEFARAIRRELDFRIEARYIRRFRHNFAGDPNVYIPDVHWDLTTERLLVTDYVDGVKVTDVRSLESWGIDPADVARRGAEAFLKQVMLDGAFHGDPHPGNVLAMPDGRLAFIDFGVVGELDERAMEILAELFLGVVGRDAGRVVQALLRAGAVDERTDLRGLRADLSDLVERNYGKSLGEMELGPILSDIFAIVQKHRIRLPHDFTLLGRALMTIEGVGKRLDPEFEVLEIASPFAAQLAKRRLDPKRIAGNTFREAMAYVETLGRIPPGLERALATLNRGELEIVFRHKGLDRLMHRLDVVSNRISLALVIAALIVGSSLVIQSQSGPEVLGVPLLGVFGYVVAGLFGIVLVFSIFRSGRF